MLSGTSYIFPPLCWALSWAHQPMERSCLWQEPRGLEQAEMSRWRSPNSPELLAPGARALLLLPAPRKLTAHPQHAHGSSCNGKHRLLFPCMSRCEGCSSAIGVGAPALGTRGV